MAFDVTGLAVYAPHDTSKVILSSVFGTKFMKEALSKATIQTGVKTKANVILMDTPVTIQSSTGCAWTPSGSATLTDKQITVASLAVQEEICAKDVQAKYSQMEMMKGSDNFDEVVFKEKLIEGKAQRLAEANENLLIKGDTAGAGNLVFLDGIAKQVLTGGVVSNAAPFTASAPILTATGITTSNVVAIFDGVQNATLAALLDSTERVVICGYDTALKYGQALRNLNLYSYAMTQGGTDEFVIPGTNTRVMPIAGMNGTNMLIGFEWSNLVIGIDGEGEDEKIELGYDSYSKKVRLEAYYKLGVTFARNSEVVYFKLN